MERLDLVGFSATLLLLVAVMVAFPKEQRPHEIIPIDSIDPIDLADELADDVDFVDMQDAPEPGVEDLAPNNPFILDV